MFSKPRLSEKDVSATLIVATFVLQIFFFVPVQVFAQNFWEFSVKYSYVLAIYMLISFILITLLGVVVHRLKNPFLLSGLTYLSVVSFLESRFFIPLAGHTPFDGSLIDWAALQWIALAELVVILLLGVLFVAIRERTEILSNLSLFIILFLGVGFAYQTRTNFGIVLHDPSTDDVQFSYLEQFYKLSDKRNIIHVVPDQTQGAMLHDILSSDIQRYSEIFDGFTLFTQAIGRYKGTYPNVVYYMAGESPEPQYDLVLNQPYTWQYVEDTLQDKSIVTSLAAKKFKTFGFQFHPGIFCKGDFTACAGTHDEVFGGVAVKTPARKLIFSVVAGLDLGFFQLTPVIVRKRIYDDGQWFAGKLVKSGATHSGILDVFTQRMQVTQNPGTYNYFHHAGAHAPLLFDRNGDFIGPQPVNWHNQREQATCTLVQLENMIRRLKKIGIYDQTMIMIHGDHGTPWLPEAYPGQSGERIPESLIGMASTLVLAKPPGVRGSLAFSDRAVTTGDVPATIVDVFGYEFDYPGVSMFGEDANVNPERYYYTYDSAARAHHLQALRGLTRYRIRGDVFDDRNWLSPEMTDIAGHPSQLYMDHPDMLAYSHGFSFLAHQPGPVRWVEGTRAGVLLMPPVKGPLALVFESYVPPGINGQWMEITVQGNLLARLDAKALAEKRHTLLLEGDISRSDVLEIEFTMGKTLKPENDRRLLSVLFHYVGLVPAG